MRPRGICALSSDGGQTPLAGATLSSWAVGVAKGHIRRFSAKPIRSGLRPRWPGRAFLWNREVASNPTASQAFRAVTTTDTTTLTSSWKLLRHYARSSSLRCRQNLVAHADARCPAGRRA